MIDKNDREACEVYRVLITYYLSVKLIPTRKELARMSKLPVCRVRSALLRLQEYGLIKVIPRKIRAIILNECTYKLNSKSQVTFEFMCDHNLQGE